MTESRLEFKSLGHQSKDVKKQSHYEVLCLTVLNNFFMLLNNSYINSINLTYLLRGLSPVELSTQYYLSTQCDDNDDGDRNNNNST